MNQGPYDTYEAVLTPAPPDNPSGLPIGPTGSATTSITYVGPPTGAPPNFSSFVVDGDGRVWVYWAGEWH